jgi:hypothetical protein
VFEGIREEVGQRPRLSLDVAPCRLVVACLLLGYPRPVAATHSRLVYKIQQSQKNKINYITKKNLINSPLSHLEVTNLIEIFAPILGQLNIILTNLAHQPWQFGFQYSAATFLGFGFGFILNYSLFSF